MKFCHALCSVCLLAAGVALAEPAAHPPQAQTRIACLGEQTTHSFHRENDPEYPFFLGETLDADFKIDAQKYIPMPAGFSRAAARVIESVTSVIRAGLCLITRLRIPGPSCAATS